jgi:hypothetical protein
MDTLPFAVAVMAPGLIVATAGVILLIWSRGGTRTSPVVGQRLFYFGLGLLYLVPGFAITAATIAGQLLWPAALGGLFSIMLGVGVLYGLRRTWAAPH